ncbi:glycosyltransferase family 4 protein [Candidatus Peregrinibacteria bacterium]|nr:glycosyltransferase family 4 protein [Candidatus Peregrinibacteria bacterium]
MRITYVTHTRFPTEKAHGHQIAQVCAAMRQLGHEVTLVHPNVWTQVQGDPCRYYGVSAPFTVKRLNSLDALQKWWIPGYFAFAISMWSYRRVLRTFLKTHEADLFYCRSWEVVGELLRTGTSVHMELHTLPRMNRKTFVKYCNQCTKIICLTSMMRDAIVRWGVDAKKTMVEPDGVDLDRFASLPETEVSKSEFDVPSNRWVIGYVGSLVTRSIIEKGMRELVQALAIIKRGEAKFFGWIVGGPDAYIGEYKRQAQKLGLTQDDVRFEGQILSSRVSHTIAACDVCVYPAPRDAEKHAYFMRDTSPLKLFEYLAAGKPVVCSDIPPIRDTVDESMVTFCKAGDPRSMADAIEWVLNHPEEAQRKAQRGKEHVKRFDWKERMKRILSHFPLPAGAPPP